MTQALMAINTLPVPSALGSLDAYIGAVNRVPVLTVEDEQALARRYIREEDLDSAKRLVLSHLRFVVHVARGYSGYGLQLADLIQEGNIGLMKAVKRFDPDQGVRLVSFAVHWVRAEMHEFILRNWRIVKVATTKAQRKLFFNLRKSKKRLGWMSAARATARSRPTISAWHASISRRCRIPAVAARSTTWAPSRRYCSIHRMSISRRRASRQESRPACPDKAWA